MSDPIRIVAKEASCLDWPEHINLVLYTDPDPQKSYPTYVVRLSRKLALRLAKEILEEVKEGARFGLYE